MRDGVVSRPLNWLLASSAVSNLGDGIGKVAFPLLAATLTRDPVLIAGLAATQFLPWLLFALPAGALMDRVDRRRAMIGANLARAGVVAATGLLVLSGSVSIWLVYVAALLIGTAETVADTAANVLIPSMVDRPGLEGANSKLQAAEIVGQTFLGGPLGSLTFVVFAASPFLLNSVGFVLAAALLLGVTGGCRSRPAKRAPARLRTDLAEGLRWLRGHRLLTRLVLVAGLLSLAVELAQAQLVLYALEDLRLSEAAFGLFAFVGGAGGLAGAALAPRLIRSAGRLGVLAGSMTATGIAFVAMGFVTDAVAAAALFGVFAAAIVTGNVVLGTLRHALVPDALLGRVLGVWRTVVWGAIPVGALLGGLLTRAVGSAGVTFAASGALQIAIAALAVLLLRAYSAEVNERSAA
ncbi:MFS transporter [Amycolatopsis antarctica]|uniref:MFS transporter n=1 Tax=Amycolatopsis antarctica TaxID=1854586 RepID=A0A263D3Y6_9PSEU|nr:MFS transporter [Amycolatopsis antarctica]OZM73194.1 MFS transporter [Amycolatopsis antarctica]